MKEITREKEKTALLQSREIVRERLEIGLRDAVEGSGHQRVAARAPVLAVLQHHFGEEFLALAGEARHLLAAVEVRLMAAGAAVLRGDRLAFFEQLFVYGICCRRGFQA